MRHVRWRGRAPCHSAASTRGHICRCARSKNCVAAARPRARISLREEIAMREPNLDKLNELVGKLVGDLGASLAGASILLGDRLGLYKAMADGTPVTSAELAKKTGLHERYVREWLSAQAASGYIDYQADTNTFALSPEQAMAFAEEGSPAFFAGAFEVVQSTYLDEP